MLRDEKTRFFHESKKESDFSSKNKNIYDKEEESENHAQKKYVCEGKRKQGFLVSDFEESDSSDGEEDGDSDSGKNLCPICLGQFKDQMIGVPEHCKHIFCVVCIKEWSKNANNCPVDRKKFNKIIIKDASGNFIEEITIEDVKCTDDVYYEETPTYCQMCGGCDREDCMLLCDGCDNGYHLYCLTPPLNTVPVGEWFCIHCDPSVKHNPTYKGINNSSNRTPTPAAPVAAGHRKAQQEGPEKKKRKGTEINRAMRYMDRDRTKRKRLAKRIAKLKKKDVLMSQLMSNIVIVVQVIASRIKILLKQIQIK